MDQWSPEDEWSRKLGVSEESLRRRGSIDPSSVNDQIPISNDGGGDEDTEDEPEVIENEWKTLCGSIDFAPLKGIACQAFARLLLESTDEIARQVVDGQRKTLLILASGNPEDFTFVDASNLCKATNLKYFLLTSFKDEDVLPCISTCASLNNYVQHVQTILKLASAEGATTGASSVNVVKNITPEQIQVLRKHIGTLTGFFRRLSGKPKDLKNDAPVWDELFVWFQELDGTAHEVFALEIHGSMCLQSAITKTVEINTRVGVLCNVEGHEWLGEVVKFYTELLKKK